MWYYLMQMMGSIEDDEINGFADKEKQMQMSR
jgi:hypothetical protein